MENRPVTLKVAGQTLKLRTDQPDEVLRDVVGMVDARVIQIRGKAMGPANAKLLTMVAMMLATELREALAELDHASEDTARRAEEALAWLDHVKLESLQTE